MRSLPNRRTTVRLSGLILGAVLLAACGSGETAAPDNGVETSASSTTGSSAEASGEIIIVAKQVDYPDDEMTATAGTYEITLDNQDTAIRHNMHIIGGSVDNATPLTRGPDMQSITVDLAPGTYEYFCDAHPLGMRGVLTVT